MPNTIVRKLHQLFDEATETWHDTYEAPGVEGIPIRVEVPREDRQPQTLRRHLLRKGADEAAVADLDILAAIIASDAPVVRRAWKAGWRGEHGIFVSHHHVAGGTGGTTIVPPVSPLVGVGSRSELRGTLEEWRALVGIARHSTAMTVALCSVFAAPLLALLQRPSFAIMLVGPTRVGKSLAQLMAASALGFGCEADLPSLNATPAGLIAAAIEFNDHMLPINEVGTARGPKREIYVALRDGTYALMNGQDTLRHPSWTGAGSSPSGSFRVICLLSSEYSPDAWAARNGEIRDPGEMARLIGVPVLFEGCKTVFDHPPSDVPDAGVKAWADDQFLNLWQNLPQQRGIAFRDYIDILLCDVDAYSDQARELVAGFVERVAKPTMTSVMQDIVAKFGVLYAGGICACEGGVLPLHADVIFRAVRDACRDALGELPDPDSELRADIRQLRDKLTGGSILDLDNASGRERRLMRNADGYHQPHKAGRLYVVRAQVFASWFDTPLRTRRLLEWLDDEGFLDHDRPRTQTRSIEWAQRQPTWPDETRVRSISLYLPAGIADLERSG